MEKIELFDYLDEFRNIYKGLVYRGTEHSVHCSANDKYGYSEFVILGDGRYTIDNLGAGTQEDKFETKRLLHEWSTELKLVNKIKQKTK